MNVNFSVLLQGIAAACGACLHIFHFRKNEHHMYGVKYLKTIAGLSVAAVLYLAFARGQLVLEAVAAVAKICFAGLFGLYSSLLLYRLFLHPLHKFPGPINARITSLWFSFHVRRSDAHKRLLELHRKYGSFVRIGSSDLSITDPNGVAAIYGVGSECRKGSWYDEDYPRCSIHTSRDHAFHKQRRRLWSPAFSDKALRGYEQRIRKYNTLLTEKLKSTHGNPVNASHWLNWWSFDVMGDLSFNSDFGMLEMEKQHWAIALLNEAMGLQGLHLPTWIFRMITSIPGIAANYWRFIEYCDQQLFNRMKSEPSAADVMSSLLPTLKQSPDEKQDMLTLLSDSRTLIIAGSDTTAATLTHCFYQLAKHPQYVDKIREEAISLLDANGEIEDLKLQQAEYLNGLINETLRLNPVVPAIIQRKTPSEGIQIGGTYIPGNINVSCPQYVLGRDPSNYEKPESFIPERWFSQPEMVKEMGAYAPFSTGVYGCIGRPLALMQLRTVIVSLLTSFHVSFAPGETGEGFIRDTKDQFTLSLADLHLCFTNRAIS